MTRATIAMLALMMIGSAHAAPHKAGNGPKYFPPCHNGWVDRMALMCPGQEAWRDKPHKPKKEMK